MRLAVEIGASASERAASRDKETFPEAVGWLLSCAAVPHPGLVCPAAAAWIHTDAGPADIWWVGAAGSRVSSSVLPLWLARPQLSVDIPRPPEPHSAPPSADSRN